MYQIDMVMYEQMGFTKEQVTRAYQYSQKNKVDIFDALQYLQKRQNQNSGFTSPTKNVNQVDKSIEGSLLYPFKTVNLNNYEIVYSTKNSRMSLPGKKIDIRDEYSPVGLLNVYNCCYLNSLLQCYFLSSDLISYILEAEPLTSLQNIQKKASKTKIKRIQNEYNLLYTLKETFSKMCLTSKKYIDPTQVLKNLVDSVGEKIQFGQQKDLFETNILIIERLNQCLLYTKKYYRDDEENSDQNSSNDLLNLGQNKKSLINNSKIKERDNIKRLFYGKKIQFTDPVNKNHQVQQVLSDFLGIIINPANQNLYKALHEQFHYQVEIQVPEQKRKVKTKKHTYIRQVPEYLYFYINRTGYNAQEKQALKNQEKLSFDFVIYMDRFLEKYKQQASANTSIIIELWKKKNILQKKINAFDIFAKKLQECSQLASSIDGWKQKLPMKQQVDLQRQTLEKQLSNIDKQLEKIQSRKEKYYLLYIFVHRGDAISGHYWGYGRNTESWYKFDINTKTMKEQQILLDLYKCGGTPYALVYVKQNKLPKTNYRYYKDFYEVSQDNLIEVDIKKMDIKSDTYISKIPLGLKKVIIAQNIQLHTQHAKRRNFQITSKVLKEYLSRFTYIQSQAEQIRKKTDNSLRNLPSYDNFSIYLWTKGEIQLAKYNIFAVSLKSIDNLSTKQLIQDEPLLSLVQKQFKKKVKKNKALKHFCIQYEPQQGKKYVQLLSQYVLQKQMFILLLRLFNHIEDLQNSKNFSEDSISKINSLLKKIASVIKRGINNKSYIRHILNQMVAVFLLFVVLKKFPLNINEQQFKTISNQNLRKQIQILEKIDFPKGNVQLQPQTELAKKNERGQAAWPVQSVGKGPNRQILLKKMSFIVILTKRQIQIIKMMQKEGKFIELNSLTGQIQDYKQQNKKQSLTQSLI